MNWRNKINIKQRFGISDDEITAEYTAETCKLVISQLKKILTKEEEATDHEDEDEQWYFINELEELIDHFEFLVDLASGKIKKENWSVYGYNGDHLTEFNGHLESLYNLGDRKISLRNGLQEKFLWVK